MNETKGFLQALFDFSFTSFITSKIVKLLHGLSILGAGLTNLPPTGWTPASPAPVIVDGQYVVTNKMTGEAKFYRLKRP